LTGRAHRFTALLVAALLLLGQAAFGPGAAMSASADPLDAIRICHASADQTPAPAQPPAHRTECLLCVICHALNGPAVLPAAAAAALAPSAPVVAALALLPPSRAPQPPPFLAAGYPTGPPILS